MKTKTERIKGYRVVLEMDAEWFSAVAEMTSYREYGELMQWISTEEIEVEVTKCAACDDVLDPEDVDDHQNRCLADDEGDEDSD